MHHLSLRLSQLFVSDCAVGVIFMSALVCCFLKFMHIYSCAGKSLFIKNLQPSDTLHSFFFGTYVHKVICTANVCRKLLFADCLTDSCNARSCSSGKEDPWSRNDKIKKAEHFEEGWKQSFLSINSVWVLSSSNWLLSNCQVHLILCWLVVCSNKKHCIYF